MVTDVPQTYGDNHFAIYINIKLVCCTLKTGLPWWLSSKESAYQCRRCGFDHRVRKIP